MTSDLPLLALVPGSRKGEIRNNLPVMQAVASLHPGLQPVVAGGARNRPCVLHTVHLVPGHRQPVIPAHGGSRSRTRNLRHSHARMRTRRDATGCMLSRQRIATLLCDHEATDTHSLRIPPQPHSRRTGDPGDAPPSLQRDRSQRPYSPTYSQVRPDDADNSTATRKSADGSERVEVASTAAAEIIDDLVTLQKHQTTTSI